MPLLLEALALSLDAISPLPYSGSSATSNSYHLFLSFYNAPHINHQQRGLSLCWSASNHANTAHAVYEHSMSLHLMGSGLAQQVDSPFALITLPAARLGSVRLREEVYVHDGYPPSTPTTAFARGYRHASYYLCPCTVGHVRHALRASLRGAARKHDDATHASHHYSCQPCMSVHFPRSPPSRASLCFD
jgi:hypothetical protein